MDIGILLVLILNTHIIGPFCFIIHLIRLRIFVVVKNEAKLMNNGASHFG